MNRSNAINKRASGNYRNQTDKKVKKYNFSMEEEVCKILVIVDQTEQIEINLRSDI